MSRKRRDYLEDSRAELLREGGREERTDYGGYELSPNVSLHLSEGKPVKLHFFGTREAKVIAKELKG